MQFQSYSNADCIGAARLERHSVVKPQPQKCYHSQIPLSSIVVLLGLSMLSYVFRTAVANPDAKRLYDDLMSSYNRLIRPVGNNSDRLTVKMGLKLSQLIDVNLRSQIMTTNVWVNQEWSDHKLRWDPTEYGGVTELYVPAEQIWLPDIVLYNNADGNYEVTIMTKAIINNEGTVIWNPPAIYKSSCLMDVQYFPFDQQLCSMKFGSWTYDGFMVDLKHIRDVHSVDLVPLGIDLTEFYLSVEWDIMSVPAKRTEKFYACCEEPYPDITFNITLRRKTLFYTVNLIIPCVGISCLSILVFYLPSDSGEKVSLSISIMLSLTFFLLVLVEIIPPTSLAMPLLGKYLVFTMILVTVSVLVAIAVLNVHFRSPSTHKMSPWVRRIFIRILPRLLLMRSPQYKIEIENEEEAAQHPPNVPANVSQICRDNFHLPRCRNNNSAAAQFDMVAPPLPAHLYSSNDKRSQLYGDGIPEGAAGMANSPPLSPLRAVGAPIGMPLAEELLLAELDTSPGLDRQHFPRVLEKAIHYAMFIAQHIDNNDDFESIREDWKYVAMVLDRLFLWIFTIACIVGTAGIFLQAPSLYDQTVPIDVKHSRVARRMLHAAHLIDDDELDVDL
ncbi:acetylcholine receptor subunit alpha 1-like [Tropilaelaps mercedesae]|uniref:Acetylcholine receptor subunit alpha 1-like n=1 Tax=Tropilaelaps mercedesae TaxID=418985 RepID=A0A1V9XBF0_9ACAR|nr:acetylcholine receptor subunit alpha 1-like [Tropilaelaps mercedesae]